MRMVLVKVTKKAGDIMTLVKIKQNDDSTVEIYVPSFQYEKWKADIQAGKINITTELEKTIDSEFNI